MTYYLFYVILYKNIYKIITGWNFDRYYYAILKMFCLIRKHDLLLFLQFPLPALLLVDPRPPHNQGSFDPSLLSSIADFRFSLVLEDTNLIVSSTTVALVSSSSFIE